MEWEGREESSNVEDERGSGGRAGMAVGGGKEKVRALEKKIRKLLTEKS